MSNILAQITIALSAISAFVTVLVYVRAAVSKSELKYFYGITVILLLSSIIIILSGSKPINEECKVACKSELYHNGLSNNTAQYATAYSDTVDLNTKSINFAETRRTQLWKVFLKADAIAIRRWNRFSYQQKIGNYLLDDEVLSKKVIREFVKNRFIFINEKVDSNDCRYTAAICLAKSKAADVDSLLQVAAASSCMKNAIDNLIGPLHQNGEITLSFYQIFSSFCQTCPKDPRVIYWLKETDNKASETDSIYFESGRYRLSLTSMMMLKYVAASLASRKDAKFTVLLTGYTDSRRIARPIPYDEAGHYDHRAGMPLPGGEPLTLINNNIQLSYARAYSCYNYLNDMLSSKKVSLFYTGQGVSKIGGLPDPHQRAVTINIKKEDKYGR